MKNGVFVVYVEGEDRQKRLEYIKCFHKIEEAITYIKEWLSLVLMKKVPFNFVEIIILILMVARYLPL